MHERPSNRLRPPSDSLHVFCRAEPRLLPLVLVGSLLFLAACMRPPAQLDVGPFQTVALTAARMGQDAGARVRWGGEIVEVTPGKENTCFEVLEQPLNDRARPERTDNSQGRFLACAPGFYDPAVYAKGRVVTVTGTLEGKNATAKIGNYEYEYPRVNADEVYLWPKERHTREVYYVPSWYYPWYPWGPFGPWYYPY
jgi:outer membrane lipoprotein